MMSRGSRNRWEKIFGECLILDITSIRFAYAIFGVALVKCADNKYKAVSYANDEGKVEIIEESPPGDLELAIANYIDMINRMRLTLEETIVHEKPITTTIDEQFRILDNAVNKIYTLVQLLRLIDIDNLKFES
jgi:hypothetical protein